MASINLIYLHSKQEKASRAIRTNGSDKLQKRLRDQMNHSQYPVFIVVSAQSLLVPDDLTVTCVALLVTFIEIRGLLMKTRAWFIYVSALL